MQSPPVKSFLQYGKVSVTRSVVKPRSENRLNSEASAVHAVPQPLAGASQGHVPGTIIDVLLRLRDRRGSVHISPRRNPNRTQWDLQEAVRPLDNVGCQKTVALGNGI